MKCNAYHLFFKNLSNPLKIKIVETLKVNSMSVNELGKKLKIEQSKLSHALANLRFCNVVKCHQEGKKRIYFLNKKTILPILKIIDENKKRGCPGCKLKK